MDNSEVLKLIQEQQKWDNIKYCITIIITALPNLLLLWQNYKKNRPNSKLRLIRVRAAKAKLDAETKARRDKLNIEEAAIKEEAAHEAELRKMEVGHQSEEQTDLFSSFKDKTTNFLKDKVGKVDLDKLAEKLGKAKDK